MNPSPTTAPARGWLPHPLLSLLLASVWLLLQQSLALPQLITAGVLGLVVPRLVAGFLGPANRVHRPLRALRFAGIVLWDIVVSNLTVARIVLDPRSRPQPAWVKVPLDTQHPLVITLLATIITTTPGTVSCVVDEERGVILVHALDAPDAQAVVDEILLRYAKPLKEILE